MYCTRNKLTTQLLKITVFTFYLELELKVPRTKLTLTGSHSTVLSSEELWFHYCWGCNLNTVLQSKLHFRKELR